MPQPNLPASARFGDQAATPTSTSGDLDSRLWSSLREAADGDPDAFAAFYDASCSRVYGLVLTIVRSPNQAAELTQSLYADIWRDPRALLSARLVLPALLAMAHCRAVDSARASDNASQPYSQPCGPRPRLSLPRVTSLHDVLLSPLQQESLVLSYLGGYTVRQVSFLLSLPTAAVSDAITRGLAGLGARSAATIP